MEFPKAISFLSLSSFFPAVTLYSFKCSSVIEPVSLIFKTLFSIFASKSAKISGAVLSSFSTKCPAVYVNSAFETDVFPAASIADNSTSYVPSNKSSVEIFPSKTLSTFS